MKLITRDTDYAVRALCFMAGKENGAASASELHKELRIPRPFLRKILQRLNKEGILVSSKGKGGGFELARAAGMITVNDVIGAFQGQMTFRECRFKKKECPNTGTCRLRKKLGEIERIALNKFKAITILSLTGAQRG